MKKIRFYYKYQVHFFSEKNEFICGFIHYVCYFSYLSSGCISNSGENYNLFESTATEMPNTVMQSRQD